MAYRALYRQWRPKDFSHMVGQKAIIDTLRNQVITGRIAHAYLFCGSRGTGKTSTAKILARAINCEHPDNGDPCGKCASCQRMEGEESLDIIEIDAASNNGVDEMRDLRDTVKYPPQFGRYKVYIIDEVHMLSTSAFNALLKTLEEPPAHVVFILATTEPQKLPETILSRCQRFDFGRIATSDIQSRLKEAAEGAGAEVSPGALMVIARAAEGGMRDALSMLDMCLGYGDHLDEEMVRKILGTCDRAFLFRFTGSLGREEAGEVFRMIDQLMREGRDPSVFAHDVSQHIRSLLLARSCPEELETILDLTAEDAAEFREQAEQFTVTRLMKILDLFMSLETEMRFSASPRLALENVALKCCVRTLEPDSRALTDRIDELEKRIAELTEKLSSGAYAPAPPAASGKAKKTAAAVPEPRAETAPAAPAPKNLPAAGGGDFKAVWKSAMDVFRKNDPGVWSMLGAGTVISAEQDVFLWQPDDEKSGSFYVDPLNKDEKRNRISRQLTEMTGRECNFRAQHRPTQAKQERSAEDEIAPLADVFGREAIQIID